MAGPQLELQGQLPIPDSLALNMAGTAASHTFLEPLKKVTIVYLGRLQPTQLVH